MDDMVLRREVREQTVAPDARSRHSSRKGTGTGTGAQERPIRLGRSPEPREVGFGVSRATGQKAVAKVAQSAPTEPRESDERGARAPAPAVIAEVATPESDQPTAYTIPFPVLDDWLDFSEHPVAKRLRDFDVTNRQKKWVLYWMTASQGNGAMACRMAGYSEKAAKQQHRRNITEAYLFEVRAALCGMLGVERRRIENVLAWAAENADLPPVRVYVKPVYHEGALVAEGYWTESPSVPHLGMRIKAAEKLLAMAEGGKPEETDRLTIQFALPAPVPTVEERERANRGFPLCPVPERRG